MLTICAVVDGKEITYQFELEPLHKEKGLEAVLKQIDKIMRLFEEAKAGADIEVISGLYEGCGTRIGVNTKNWATQDK